MKRFASLGREFQSYEALWYGLEFALTRGAQPWQGVILISF
jgi:hypothetical protein